MVSLGRTRFSRVDYRDVAEVASIAFTEERLRYEHFEFYTDRALNRHEVVSIMSDVLGRLVIAKEIESPSTNGGQKLAQMFNWYDKHSLLENAMTLRVIPGRNPAPCMRIWNI